MRNHKMLLGSLFMYSIGILCQLYSVFNPDEPYAQQMSFMCVAMPSVLAIINHYNRTPLNADAEPDIKHPLIDSDAISTSSRNCVLNQSNSSSKPHDAVDTSQRHPHISGYDALSGYKNNDTTDVRILD